MALSASQERIWSDAKAAGYDDEAARVAVAIATAEGLDATHPGDAGHSVGVWQFWFGAPGEAAGVGNSWAQAIGMAWSQAKATLLADPNAANRWWLTGQLGGAIQAGRSLGLSGPDLARWAGQQAERPAAGNEQRYADAYQAIFGPGAAPGPIGIAPQPPLPAPPELPDRPGRPEAPPDGGAFPWWVRTPGEPPGTAGTTAESSAIQNVASPLGQLAAVLTPGSSPWASLWGFLLKLLASLVAAILIVVGLLRVTGTDKQAVKLAGRAAKAAVVAA